MPTDKTSLIIPCLFFDESAIKMTEDCLASLEFGRPDEVIVVDDGSPLKMHTLEAGLQIRLRQNHGFAGAVNAGLAVAQGDILIIANNDIIFTPGWLEALVKPLTLGYDISSIVTSDQTWETRDEITEGDKFGSLWAMKRKVYDTLGGLDERFGKGYFEDTDYRRRAIRAGFKIGKNHSHLVEHLGRATFDRIDPEHRLYENNKQVYIDKHGELE